MTARRKRGEYFPAPGLKGFEFVPAFNGLWYLYYTNPTSFGDNTLHECAGGGYKRLRDAFAAMIELKKAAAPARDHIYSRVEREARFEATRNAIHNHINKRRYLMDGVIHISEGEGW